MLHVYKTTAMQTMVNAATNGYFYASYGIVEADKLKAFHDKIYRRYGINRSRAAFSKDRRKGRPVVKLIIHPCSEFLDPDGFHWFLLSTLPIEGERLFDIRKAPIVFGGQYELVRLSKTGKSEPGWTWRMTKDFFENWSNTLIKNIRWKQERQVLFLANSIANAPHHSGIRNQRKQLWKLINKEWKKTFRENQPPPKLPLNKFKRMVKVQAVKQISRFVNDMKSNNRTSMQQLRIYRKNLEIRKKRSAEN